MNIFLEFLDIYSHTINFNFKRKPQFHTNLGQFISILTYVVLLFCFYKFSEDFLNMKNPKLSMKEKIFQNDLQINFTKILDSINYTFASQ